MGLAREGDVEPGASIIMAALVIVLNVLLSLVR